MSAENGTSQWHELTLPDSGAHILFRPVSHMLMADASKSVRRPSPPVIDVNYNGNIKQEPNANAPEYLEAMRQYGAAQNNKALEVAVLLGVQVEVDKERVSELRQSLADSGVEIPKNDKVLYVTRILCETANDLATLRDAIIRKSQPTEEAVADATERFPADVQAN